MRSPPDCLRPLTPDEYAAVPVPSPEEIRAALRRAGEELREAARTPRPMRPMRTPIGSGGAARGLPLPSSVEPSLRAGVQDEPTSSTRGAQNTQAGAGPICRKET